MSRFLRTVALLVVLAGIGFAFLRPVKLPLVVNTYGRIRPTREWTLAKGADGQLVSSTFDAKTGTNEEYRVSHFGSESTVYFSLHPAISPGNIIAVGDTIGTIVSSEIQERLIALNGQLLAARTSLAATASGQKVAIVREARQQLQHARQKKDEHQRRSARSQQMFEANLMSQAAYENVVGEGNLLDTEIAIAESRVAAAESGAKPEDLDLVQARIATLEGELAAVESRAATYTLTAPIGGRISRSNSPSTLVVISDASDFVISMPVEWRDHFHVAAARDVELRSSGSSTTMHGRIASLDDEVHLTNGRQVVVATAVLDGLSNGFVPGMLAKCRIECQPLTPFEHMMRLFD